MPNLTGEGGYYGPVQGALGGLEAFYKEKQRRKAEERANLQDMIQMAVTMMQMRERQAQAGALEKYRASQLNLRERELAQRAETGRQYATPEQQHQWEMEEIAKRGEEARKTKRTPTPKTPLSPEEQEAKRLAAEGKLSDRDKQRLSAYFRDVDDAKSTRTKLDAAQKDRTLRHQVPKLQADLAQLEDRINREIPWVNETLGREIAPVTGVEISPDFLPTGVVRGGTEERGEKEPAREPFTMTTQDGTVIASEAQLSAYLVQKQTPQNKIDAAVKEWRERKKQWESSKT